MEWSHAGLESQEDEPRDRPVPLAVGSAPKRIDQRERVSDSK